LLNLFYLASFFNQWSEFNMRQLLILAVILTCAGCASQRTVDVYLTQISPMPSTLFEQRAKVELRIQNLSETPIQATGIDVTLRLNDQRLARGVDGQAFTVPRLGETTTSVIVSSSVFDTIRQVLSMRNVETFTYGLKGRVITDGLDRRFARRGQIDRADLMPLVGEGQR
jgi:LEA14-like dessication related protein